MNRILLVPSKATGPFYKFKWRINNPLLVILYDRRVKLIPQHSRTEKGIYSMHVGFGPFMNQSQTHSRKFERAEYIEDYVKMVVIYQWRIV